MLRQFALRDHAIEVMHEVRQHSKFVARQSYDIAIYAYLPRPWIQDQGAALQFGIDLSAGAPDEGAQAGKQFLHAEWLC